MPDKFIPYSTQDIDDSDIAAVVEALKHPFITQGPAIEAFEAAIADYCNVPHVVAVSNGTAALQVALAGMGVDGNSLVWSSPITFVGTTNAALMLGARVGFVDIDMQTGNMCPDELDRKLQQAAAADDLPSVVIPVHFSGRACDMERIHALCTEYGVKALEDGAHAIGGRYAEGRPIGDSTLSDACTFSFHPVKSFTTGEGGAITTRDADLADRMRRLRSHGTTRDHRDFVNPDQGGWYYEQIALGYNYRLTDIQAALGSSQIRRLDQFMTARRRLAERYTAKLAGLPLALPPACPSSAWHLYVIRLLKEARLDRKGLFDTLRNAGIGANVHYIPVHLQPYYAGLGFAPGDFPVSEAWYEAAISIPLYTRLSDNDQDRVISVIADALG
jgi:UDP-4-amino-4,6-dideoxy-N-acetyl-beta-L-altrosamine transaminase